MAAAADLAILDGRYQVLRQIGGPPNAPLMLASDLRRGAVVCLRLKRFSTAMARLAAVPRLASPSDGREGPLLPFDFGVDGDIAYLARPYAAATSLEARLAAGAPLPPLDALRIVTAAGQALLAAAAQGFPHPGLEPRHILITATGHVCLAGFDRLGPSPIADPVAGCALVALLRAALEHQPAADLPEALRRLLVTLATWERRGFPALDATVSEIARVEARLSGAGQPALALRAGGRAARGAAHRIRRLGPLLRPYLILGGLLAGTAALSSGAFAQHGGSNHIVVYAVAPAPAAMDPTPQPIAIATTSPRPSITSTATTGTLTIDATSVSERAIPPQIAPPGANSSNLTITTTDAAVLAGDAHAAERSTAAAYTTAGVDRSRAPAPDRVAGADQRPAASDARRSTAPQSPSDGGATRPSQTRGAAATTSASARATATRSTMSVQSTAATASAGATVTATSDQAATSVRSTQTATSTLTMTRASSTTKATRDTSATASASTSVASTRVAGMTTSETSRTSTALSTRAAR